jgi:hypothetical protein
MEYKYAHIYRLLKELKIMQELYKYVCFSSGVKALTTFFRKMASRKSLHHRELSRYLEMNVEQDYFALDDRIVNELSKELVRLNELLNQHGSVFLLEYFIKAERSLERNIKEIERNSNYDFLTNLILFESQLADIEECIKELKNMRLTYSEVDKIDARKFEHQSKMI